MFSNIHSYKIIFFEFFQIKKTEIVDVIIAT